ncbi:MAG: L-histidine N(alpha)-methyltransferase [Leptospirales bacterium]
MAPVKDSIEIISKENVNIKVFAEEVETGLSKNRKSLPARFFYDARGSEIFQQITKMPEYYLTDSERSILNFHAKEIIDSVVQYRDQPGKEQTTLQIVEFGAGDSDKPYPLIDAILETGLPFEYIAIDISITALENFGEKLNRRYNNINYRGIAGEYFECLEKINLADNTVKLVLFLGSNIGNFSFKDSVSFMHKINQYLSIDDHLLVGFDMVKNPTKLIQAYSDSTNITAEFNLNLLDRMNRELGADFHRDNFFHYATFNPTMQAMESFIISKVDQKVYIKTLDKTFTFDTFEPIHTEYSNKYTAKKIKALAEESGFKTQSYYTDLDCNFRNYLFTPVEKNI